MVSAQVMFAQSACRLADGPRIVPERCLGINKKCAERFSPSLSLDLIASGLFECRLGQCTAAAMQRGIPRQTAAPSLPRRSARPTDCQAPLPSVRSALHGPSPSDPASGSSSIAVQEATPQPAVEAALVPSASAAAGDLQQASAPSASAGPQASNSTAPAQHHSKESASQDARRA